MGLYQRGKTFWFTVTYGGRRVQQSLKTDNKKLAEKLYAKELTDIVEGRYFETTAAKRTTFNEMVTRYLEEHSHSRDFHTVKPLLKFFKGYTLFEVSTRLIAEYRSQRSKVVKPATVYQELALMRRMFNVAIKEWEWIKDNPVSRLSFAVGKRMPETGGSHRMRSRDCLPVPPTPSGSTRSSSWRYIPGCAGAKSSICSGRTLISQEAF